MQFLKGVSLFIFLCWLGSVGRIYAQGEVSFGKLTSEKGAYQSIVYGLAQDSFGNIWSSSENGITRFNSQEAFLYNKYRGLPPDFGNRISAIHLDAQHTLWIGSEKGIARYHAALDTFEMILSETQKRPLLVKEILSDQEGNIWVGGFNGVWKYKPEDATEKAHFSQFSTARGVENLTFLEEKLLIGGSDHLLLLDIPSHHLDTLALRNSAGKSPIVTSTIQFHNQLLLGTKGSGLYRANADLSLIQSVPLALFDAQKPPIYQIVREGDGTLFLGTDGQGLIQLSSDFELLENFQNDVNDPRSISSDGIYDLLRDEEGILWIATYGGGINYLNPSQNRFTPITHQINEPNSIAHQFTRSVMEDQGGNIWFGTKQGISIWYKAQNQWKHIRNLTNKNLPNSPPYIVMTLEEDGDYVWVGTYNGGAYRIHKKTFKSLNFGPQAAPQRRFPLTKIYTICKDAQGNIWMGGIDNELVCLQPDQRIQTYPLTQVKVIVPAQQGGVWTAGKNGIQHIFQDRITHIEGLRSGQNGLDYTTINSLHLCSNGDLLIGTNGEGLLIYHPDSKQFKKLTVKDGLPSDIIQGILTIDNQDIWVSTSSGLAHIHLSPVDTTILIFDKSDGLASTEHNYGSYLQLNDGKMIFGGTDGLTLFNPAEIRSQKDTPKIVFEEIRVLNHEVKPGEAPLVQHINATAHVKLTYWENAISLRFVGILHSTPSKVQYTWKLDGFDQQWSQTSLENQTNFTNLSPGDYIFRVKAANRDGLWGPEKQLKISVAPPWWATNLAIISYVLIGLIGLGVGLYILGIVVNKRNAEQQIDFFNNITHELKTPLTILLSSLDNLSQKDEEKDASTEKIKSTVIQLNTLFDQLLNFHRATSDHHLNSDIRKMDLQGHVEELIARFTPLLTEKKLTLQVDSSWEKEVFYFNAAVFDKILFNLISNAIKYSKEDGHIHINLRAASNTQLKVSVVDDGIGIPKDQQKNILKRYYRGRNAVNSQLPGTGLGLIMVKNLVEKNGGNIQFKSVENEGTTFSVTLPDKQAQYHKSALLTNSGQKLEEIYDSTRIEAFKDAKILIVEDNDELRAILVKKLSVYFNVYEASNGKMGLQKVSEIFPDLILTDLIMPEMDGMTMCKTIMEDINLNHIPVFMMTVLNNSSQKLESIEKGVTEYMEKPIDFNLLLAKMANALTWQAKLQKKYQHEVEIETAQTFRNERDAEFINKMEKFTLEHIQDENFSVNDLCEFVGMSRTSLYMKLKNLTDMSPQDFIINTRLKYARKLLTNGHGRIKEVAYDCGFSNPKYFSTSFKKQFGLSPSQFLESLKEK